MATAKGTPDSNSECVRPTREASRSSENSRAASAKHGIAEVALSDTLRRKYPFSNQALALFGCFDKTASYAPRANSFE